MAAKNKASLTKFVWIPFIRTSGSQWAWFELASARWVAATINTTNQTVDVVCDTRDSVFQWYIPEASISLTF